MKLGIDSYSFHRFFGETTKWEEPLNEQWSLQEFLNFVEEQHLLLASLETVYLKPQTENIEEILSNWLKPPLREVVFTWGHPNGFDGGKKPEMLLDALQFLQIARSVGVNQMRIVCGNHWNFSTDPTERFELLQPLVAELLKEATQSGILLSIENHADFPVRTLMEFIESFDSPNLGLCLDLGNAIRVGDDAEAVLGELDLKKVFMIQVKDVRRIEGHEAPTGWWPTVLYGSGDVHLEKCIQVLKRRGYRNLVIVELSNLYTDLKEVEVAKQAIAFLQNELTRR